jgi:hypothetical protein
LITAQHSINQRTANYLCRFWKAVSSGVDDEMIMQWVIKIGAEIALDVTTTCFIGFPD